MTARDDELARVPDAIVEAQRKVYEFDQDVAEAYFAEWRECKAQGVIWERFLAARDLARPRVAELLKDHMTRLNEAAMEQPDKPPDSTN